MTTRSSGRPLRPGRRGRLFVLTSTLALVSLALGPAGETQTVEAAGASARPDTAASTAAAALPEDAATSDPNLPTGHEASQGLTLVASTSESVTPGSACLAPGLVRSYSVVAIGVDITLNRYLDHDPDGRMYVLEADLPRVRAEEAANQAARQDASATPGVSIGLQSDAIQPLTLRVLPGECLRITLRNDLPGNEPVSLHLHDSSLRVVETGRPAIATEPSAIAATGATVSYEWAVPVDEAEGTRYFHSEALTRPQTDHGLFGAVIVEPPGSKWLDPLTGRPTETGWQAMIVDPAGPDFREFALYYHEVGDENTRIVDRQGGFVPLVDPVTRAYRPGTRALDYRSEPFSNRLALQAASGGQPDESVAYSSYAFGDPATPMLRSYRLDPVKERVIHAGSEVAHVAHVHGGAVRWRRDTAAEPGDFASGIDKHPPLVPVASERTDSQTLGPSETFDIAHECGSGGCQGSVGDFLYHCHIGQHYFAGMWGLWRVYDTLQDGMASTDELPPLLTLPDRADAAVPAVTSDALIGRTLDPGTGPVVVTATSLRPLAEGQLPPQGAPGADDASVMDWSVDRSRYLGEPETDVSWPGYTSPAPGNRPPLLFDPRTGRLAYPFLRPHLGKRPPFAPQHGPAPFLDPPGASHEPPAPGASGPASLCPTGTHARDMSIEAVSVPVPLDPAQDLVDPAGELFVLRDHLASVLSDPSARVPLVIRANAGEDCIDATLTSRLDDQSGSNLHQKVGLHIHFVQFDVQGSDGLDAGFNYEQTVKPYTLVGRALALPAAAGSTSLILAPVTVDSGVLQAGALIGVGMDSADGFETRQIVSVRGDELVLDAPLADAHPAGQIVSAEFVRYRWYPDAQVGTSYFHDHVNGLSSWRHGLFGALIVEPPGSSYHDPHDGSVVDSGLVVDIHSHGLVARDVSGSFRELVLCVIDGTDINRVGRSTGSAIDLRAEPLDGRGGDPAALLSSTVHGDPATPVFEAYVGDPLVVRTLASATNDIQTLHIDGHPFRLEPWSSGSPPVSTAIVGISERYDLVVPEAGGPGRRAGDYLYRNGRQTKFREGSWGILRVLDRARSPSTLQPLPDRPPVAAATGDVCPRDAPVRRFDVHAIRVPLPMLHGSPGLVYALAQDVEALTSGGMDPGPLVLHADVGDCLDVHITNDIGSGDVSFHADQLVADPLTSGGITVGDDPPQTTPPGATSEYRLYADPSVGETVSLVTDYGDVLTHAALGLYGAIVVGPRGARYEDPTSGADVSSESRTAVVVRTDTGAYRDFTLLSHDSDQAIGTHRMPYTVKVAAPTAWNYHTAPRSPAPGMPDPSTPLLETYPGDPMRIHVLAPFSEQAQVFSVEEHTWVAHPGLAGSRDIDSQSYGGLQALTLDVHAADGVAALPGDYVYGDHRMPFAEGGLWGILRVRDPGVPSSLRPLASPVSGTP